MADKRSFFGRPRLLPTSTPSQLDSASSSAKSAYAGEVASAAASVDEDTSKKSADAQVVDATNPSKIALGVEKRTFFGRSLRGSSDSKWCAQCGEGTVKPDREACKFCGAVEWAAVNPHDTFSAADGYEEVRLSAAEPFGLVFTDDLTVQQVHSGSQGESSGVRVGMILRALDIHGRGTTTTNDDDDDSNRNRGRGRSCTTSDLSTLQQQLPWVPGFASTSVGTTPLPFGTGSVLPPGYKPIADKNALADAVSKVRSTVPSDNNGSQSSSLKGMIGLLFTEPSGSQRDRVEGSGSIDEPTSSPLLGAPSLPPSKSLFNLPIKAVPSGATRRLSESASLLRGNSFGEHRSEVAGGSTPSPPPPASTAPPTSTPSQRRGSGTANDFFLRPGAATRSVIMSGKGGRGGRGGRSYGGASANSSNNGNDSSSSSSSVRISTTSYDSNGDTDMGRDSAVGSATEAAFLERRSISVPEPRFALLRENSDLLGRASRDSISAAAASASGSSSRLSTTGDESSDALRASVDVSKALNRRKSLASTLLPPAALQSHTSTMTQPAATPASESEIKAKDNGSSLNSSVFENSSYATTSPVTLSTANHGDSHSSSSSDTNKSETSSGSSNGGSSSRTIANSANSATQSPHVKSILRPALKMRSNSTLVPPKQQHRVAFKDAHLRFYGYGPGGSVPGSTKGAPLGLHGDWHEHGEVHMSVDELEALRGGDPPEEGGDEEEWDDNWRVPREYFADEGTIPPQKRDEFLIASGVRRVSLDWMKHDTTQLLASRKANGATTVVAMIIAGFDIGEIYQLEKEDEAATVLGAWARKRRLARQRASKPSG